ncbi:DNA repair protein RecO [Calderihabitans maritimus]|uniref:DNA repair protein RecO n=1 Tax=Calderihabitans maritimus TaxID=1246530 RepID=A0A1Z5HV66_9FIRM|nr:DNA repair protein RecO [Calderihabitans maritimus]GAW93429.1 DNA repair protein RecO [Calderihabitans maritimus]
MRLYKAEGVVIRGRDYGEADRIITLYSRQHGKVDAIAKGVRKPKSRMRGGVQLFTFSSFLLYPGRTLDTVTQCEIIEPFTLLREDLTRFAYASYLVELVNSLVPERDANEKLFFLLLASLHLLTREDPEVSVRFFEIRLLSLLGYRPQLQNCVQCGKFVPDKSIKFSVRLGGVLCRDCSPEDKSAFSISKGALTVLDQLTKIDPRRIGRLKISVPMRQELERMLCEYILYRAERQLKSLDFIFNLRRLVTEKETHKEIN